MEINENGIIVERFSDEKLTDQELARREKLKKLEDLGVYPWGEKFERTHSILACRDAAKDKTEEELEANPINVKIAGRILLLRRKGKAAFFNIKDKEGNLQAYISIDTVGEDEYEIFKLTDIGDIVGLEGRLMLTRTGELTIRVSKFTY